MCVRGSPVLLTVDCERRKPVELPTGDGEGIAMVCAGCILKLLRGGQGQRCVVVVFVVSICRAGV